jgi:hypothetical protein
MSILLPPLKAQDKGSEELIFKPPAVATVSLDRLQ